MKDFLKELDIAISVCDKDGTIVYLNDKYAKIIEAEGGMTLIGSNILDCHPEPAKSKLKEMMSSHISNSYFKGEGCSRRLIQQTPVYSNGHFDGYIEMIIPLAAV